jgi:hypothetical protein
MYVFATGVYSGSTGSQNIQLFASTSGVTSSLDAHWFGTATATYYARFMDASTGQVLYEYNGGSWNSISGLNGFQASFTATLTQGHTYEFDFGPYVQTANGWSGTSTAQAIGTVTELKATY